MKPASWLLAIALLGPIQSLDVAIEARIQETRRPWLERPMHELTEIGRPVWVLSGLLAVALLDGGTGVATVRGCVAVLIPVNLMVEGLKWGAGRTRPDGDTRRANSSFPSSHAANAMALAWMLSRRWPRGRLAFWTLALLITWSRMYLNRHYPTDCLASAVIGIGCAILICSRWPRLDPARARAIVKSAARASESP